MYSPSAEVGDNPLPRITLQPEPSRKVQAGDSLLLECRAEGEGLEYRWYKGRSELAGQKTGQLKICPVNEDHEGDYHCLVVSNTRSVESSHTTVHVGQ